MGCVTSGAGDPKNFNIGAEYNNRGLPAIWSTDYNNEFEKEAYMTINMIRSDPKFMIPHIKGIKSMNSVN